MLTITDNGTAGIFVKYLSTPAEAIGKDLLNIPVEATHMILFTSQDTAMLYATRIYGATSSAEAVVLGYELISGTVGTTGAGILFVRDITGTFQAENIGVTAGADDATIILPVELKVAGLQPSQPLSRQKEPSASPLMSSATTASVSGCQ